MHKRIYGIERETAFFPDDVSAISGSGIYGLVEQFLPRKQNGIIVMPPNLQMLPNGSRLYCDIGSHIEIATPECDEARDAVIWDKACERILERIARSMNQPPLFTKASREILEKSGGVTFLKTSTGARVCPQELRNQKYLSRRSYVSFGTHLNLCASRPQTNHVDATAVLAPFLLASYWFSGSGLLWVGDNGTMPYSLSQRVPFLTRLYGSAAMSYQSEDGAVEDKKPLFIFRPDETHADSNRYFRVHIGGADSCMNEWLTYMLLWGCGIILRMLEDGFIRSAEYEEDVKRLFSIAHKTKFWGDEANQFLFRGESHTVTSLHRKYYLEPILAYKASGVLWSGEEEDGLRKYEFLLNRFEQAVSSLERVKLFAPYADWAAKLYYWILPDMRRNDYGWDAPPGEIRSFPTKSGQSVKQTVWARIKFFDNFYHDVRRNKGLYYILERKNLVRRIIEDDAPIAHAEEYPPPTTRAHGRTERFKALYRENAREISSVPRNEWSKIRYYPADGPVGICVTEDNPDQFNPDPAAFVPFVENNCERM